MKYFINPRYDLIHFLPANKNGLKVLETRAGSTIFQLEKSGIANEVVGIELFELPGTLQKDGSLDQFIIGNIEGMEMGLPKNHFDAILFGDVLEHLLVPWKVISKLTPHLAIEGRLIASIPNVRNRKTFRNIFIKGDFKTESQGLFDKTHFRWFCKKNIIDLLISDIQELVSVTSNLEFKKGSGTRLFNRLTGRIFEEFLMVQFITVTKRIK